MTTACSAEALQMHLSASLLNRSEKELQQLKHTPAFYIFDEMIIAGKWRDP